MNKVRKALSSKIFIHTMILLGLLALWDFIETANKYILLGFVASFAGSICGSFIRIFDKMETIQ